MIPSYSVHSLGKSVFRKLYRLKKVGNRKLIGFYRSLRKEKSGLNLVGYFSYASGIAEVGRFFVQYIKTSKIDFSIYDIEAPGYKIIDLDSLQTYQPYFTTKTIFDKNIFFINADQISNIKETYPELFIGRYNAAVFFWEFNDYFDFPLAFEVINEVIAFTNFIATAVRKAAPSHIRVTKLEFPFIKNWEITKLTAAVRDEFNITRDTFVFIFNFDFHSVYERKNPEAIVRAFEAAFSPVDNVTLILKTIHAELDNKNLDKFNSVISNTLLRDKIKVINENLSRNDFMSLINASDSYISLHRSEGLGLGMMEAMSMGKPVIATNYGGNTDFMNSDNALLVNYRLVPLSNEAGPYKIGWLWAEADISEAAAYMHQLYQDRAFANSLGKRARQYIEERYNKHGFSDSINAWMEANTR